MVIFTNFKLGGVVGGRVGGGFPPNNQATLWPNLHAQDKQDSNSSWNCKLGPSVAKNTAYQNNSFNQERESYHSSHLKSQPFSWLFCSEKYFQA